MKKLILIITTLAITLLCASCGKTEVPALKTLADEIKENAKFEELYEAPLSSLSDEYGINEEMYSEAVFMLPADSMRADRMVIIKAKDTQNAKTIEEKLNTMLTSLKNTSKDYSPDMFEIFSKSSVKTSGEYVYLIVTDDIDNANKVLKKYF